MPWLAAFWNAAFIVVNVGRIAIETRETCSVKLSPEERDVHASTFANLSPVEFAKLLAVGQWRTLEKDALITEQDKPVENVLLVYQGAAAVHINGNFARDVTAPEFIGEVSFLTSDKASATVTAREPMRVLVGYLAQFDTRDPSRPELQRSNAACRHLCGQDFQGR